jgi:hypothetical protein
MALYRRTFLTCLLLAAAGFVQAGSKPTLGISFLVEGAESDGPRMVREMDLQGKKLFFKKMPMATHRNIKAFFPFPANDGSFGVALRVDESAWRTVREVGALDQGKLILVLVNGRIVQTMLADNPKKDDHIIVIWKGLTEAEVAQLKKSYPEIANKPAEESVEGETP